MQWMNAFLEAPGQLALELDEYPGKARLREFWRRAAALPGGLLPRSFEGSPGSSGDRRVADQGIRELVALCSVSEAYRRISGTIQAKREDKAGAQRSDTRTRDVEMKGKDFLPPLITLLTGGAVASGVAAGTAVYNQPGPADIFLAGGLSPYGTMAQGGNADEWEETELDLVNERHSDIGSSIAQRRVVRDICDDRIPKAVAKWTSTIFHELRELADH